MAPNELGAKIYGNIFPEEQKNEFNRLLEELALRYESDPMYDYVKKL